MKVQSPIIVTFQKPIEFEEGDLDFLDPIGELYDDVSESVSEMAEEYLALDKLRATFTDFDFGFGSKPDLPEYPY